MSELKNNFECRNRKSLNALIAEQGDAVRAITNPKTGKLFFTCGSVRGMISKKLQAVMKNTEKEDMEYAEVLVPNVGYIPCLFLRPKNNVEKEWR